MLRRGTSLTHQPHKRAAVTSEPSVSIGVLLLDNRTPAVASNTQATALYRNYKLRIRTPTSHDLLVSSAVPAAQDGTATHPGRVTPPTPRVYTLRGCTTPAAERDYTSFVPPAQHINRHTTC